MRLLNKLLGLAAADRNLLIEAGLAIRAIRLGLALLGYGRMRRIMERWSEPPAATPSPDPAEIQRVVWAVRAVGRRTLRGKPCLTEGMATRLLLKRRGLTAELRIGVLLPEDGRLKAHAWIEHEGRILIGGLPDLERFTPLPPVGAPKSEPA